MKNNNSYEIATVILRTFAIAKSVSNNSNSGENNFDRVVLEHIKSKIMWQDLTPDQLKDLWKKSHCFFNRESYGKLKIFIIELKRFDNNMLKLLIKDGDWQEEIDLLCSSVDWSVLSAEEAFNFCLSLENKCLWRYALEKDIFSNEQLLEIGILNDSYFAKEVILLLKERKVSAA